MTFAARTLRGSAPVSITDQSATGQNLSGVGGTSTAGYRLQNSGVAQRTLNGTYSSITGEWLLDGAVSAYEAKGTFASIRGTPTQSGPTTWTSLASTQTWTMASTNDDSDGTWTIEIRYASGSVIDTAVISMTSLSTP